MAVYQIGLAVLSGVLVKVVDWIEDDKKSKNPLRYLIAITYGAAIGYLIGTADFSVVFLSALIAQVLARKIDTMAHNIGFLVAILSTLYFGIPQIDLFLAGFFIILAVIDETEYFVHPLMKYRPFLKVGTLGFGIISGQWTYFVGIMAFDVGYELFAASIK